MAGTRKRCPQPTKRRRLNIILPSTGTRCSGSRMRAVRRRLSCHGGRADASWFHLPAPSGVPHPVWRPEALRRRLSNGSPAWPAEFMATGGGVERTMTPATPFSSEESATLSGGENPNALLAHPRCSLRDHRSSCSRPADPGTWAGQNSTTTRLDGSDRSYEPRCFRFDRRGWVALPRSRGRVLTGSRVP
jgi:hypothetical protein